MLLPEKKNKLLTARDLVKGVKQLGKRVGFWKYGFGYSNQCQQVFGELDFHGKTMLEIGCGKGIFCLWASIHGAKHVVGLEPLSTGSFDSAQCYKDFDTIVSALNLQDIEMLPCPIQNYNCRTNYFDIILSVASINHLDERSCAQLQWNAEAQQAYLSTFRRLSAMMKHGGKLIILDTSNRNFFGDFGIKNPLHPEIEWFKHQGPNCWVGLLSQCQFTDPRISWLADRRLSYFKIDGIGETLSYFFGSVFRLEMRCDKGARPPSGAQVSDL